MSYARRILLRFLGWVFLLFCGFLGFFFFHFYFIYFSLGLSRPLKTPAAPAPGVPANAGGAERSRHTDTAPPRASPALQSAEEPTYCKPRPEGGETGRGGGGGEFSGPPLQWLRYFLLLLLYSALG